MIAELLEKDPPRLLHGAYRAWHAISKHEPSSSHTEQDQDIDKVISGLIIDNKALNYAVPE